MKFCRQFTSSCIIFICFQLNFNVLAYWEGCVWAIPGSLLTPERKSKEFSCSFCHNCWLHSLLNQLQQLHCFPRNPLNSCSFLIIFRDVPKQCMCYIPRGIIVSRLELTRFWIFSNLLTLGDHLEQKVLDVI